MADRNRQTRTQELPARVSGTAAELGDAVRQARRRKKLEQTELAFLANVGVRTISQIENGKPTTRLDVLVRVLDALALDLRATERPLRVPPRDDGK